MTGARKLADSPEMRGFELLESRGWRALARRGYQAEIRRLAAGERTDEPLERVSGGRTPHPVVVIGGGERVVVRRYRRGGALRHLNRERYFLGHRAFEEARVTEAAAAAGVAVPTVVAAIEWARRPGYTAALVTRWIPAARELHDWLLGAAEPERTLLAGPIGEQIARMHAAGVAHPDLNLRNFLVVDPSGSEAPSPCLIDFDRGRLYPGPVPTARRRRDLLRLARSARKLRAPVDTGWWTTLRDGYGADWPLRAPLG